MKSSKPRFDVVGQLGSLRRYAHSLTGNDADAEDLVHDALLRAYERRHSFRIGGNLRGWLLSVLHNVFVDGIRARRSEARTEQQAAIGAERQLCPPPEHSIRLAQIRNAFYGLSEEQRAALHLVAIEGMSYEEAAATLGIPGGTLMSRIGRARASLRAFEGEKQPAVPGHLKIVGGKND